MIKYNQPEFRKDLVSGDWVLVAHFDSRKPHLFKKTKKNKTSVVGRCPFEDPQKSGNPFPLLWYPGPKTPPSKAEDFKYWFVQAIPNKYPLLLHQDKCPVSEKDGFAERLAAVGYHEVIITRDHRKTITEMSLEEIQLVLKTYKERYRVLAKDPCVKYILVFHNWGEASGASVSHPHSQLVALPIFDPDLFKSLNGSREFFKKYKKCVHCTMVAQEIADKLRIIDQNEHFITVAPFASRVPYEMRIYPLKHSSRFENLDKEFFPALARSLKTALVKINVVLDKPDYNFFIHTAPVGGGEVDHYHWHIEIYPRGFKWAGLELGGGIEVVAVSPEDAADKLRKAKC